MTTFFGYATSYANIFNAKYWIFILYFQVLGFSKKSHCFIVKQYEIYSEFVVSAILIYPGFRSTWNANLWRIVSNVQNFIF